jgi:membrane protease YdiL (CAAX protease family)
MSVSEIGQVRLYCGLVLLLSWAYEAYIVARGGVAAVGLTGIVVLMWLPGAIAIGMRLLLKARVPDTGLIAGKPRYYVYAVTIPMALAVLTGLLCAGLDIRQLTLAGPDDLPGLVPVFLTMAGIGLVGAFGEELGWRGYLLPQMIAAGVSHPYAATGAIWAAWHLPLIAFGGFYSTDKVLLVVSAYAVGTLGINLVICDLRMRSGSMWVSTLLHASHNFFFQLAVPALLFTRKGSRSDLWEIIGGDTGLVVGALYALSFLMLRRLSPGPATPAQGAQQAVPGDVAASRRRA